MQPHLETGSRRHFDTFEKGRWRDGYAQGSIRKNHLHIYGGLPKGGKHHHVIEHFITGGRKDRLLNTSLYRLFEGQHVRPHLQPLER